MTHPVCKPPITPERKVLSVGQMNRMEAKHNKQARKTGKWATPDMTLGN